MTPYTCVMIFCKYHRGVDMPKKEQNEMMKQYAFREKPSIVGRVLDKAGPWVRISDLIRALLQMYDEGEIDKAHVEKWIKKKSGRN